MATGWRAGPNGSRSTPRSRSTSCTSGRGAATSPTANASRATTNSPIRSPTMCSPTGSPTSSSSRSWSIRSTGRGAIRPPGSSPPAPATARRSDLMTMIDRLHQRGVGVILDWVPSHFPNDAHGLYEFDGTHLFEHADPRQGYHPDWNSAHLQLQPQRGPLVPRLQRDVLARPLPRRRSAGRCRRVDAVPRLLAQRGRVDPERVRRAREPRCDRVPARAERGGVRRVPRRCRRSPRSRRRGRW